MVGNLLPCPDCERLVSRNAFHCPSCGHPFVVAAREGVFLKTLNAACILLFVAAGGILLIAVSFWGLTALASIKP